MLNDAVIAQGRTGRILYARVRPNEDLVQTIEKLCLMHEMENALIRGSLGSVSQACFETQSGAVIEIAGPAVEILSLNGAVSADSGGAPIADVNGIVADPSGKIHGGRFVSGRNPVCITMEIVLEEWLQTTDSNHD